jgi:hypothetical protein
MLESIQQLAPWASGLRLISKITITAIVLFSAAHFCTDEWVPARQVAVYERLFGLTASG